MFAEIIVDIKTSCENKCFDYEIPTNLVSFLKKGMGVIVPFGTKNNYRLGYVLNIKKQSSFATKQIVEILNRTLFINDELFLIADKILETPFVTKTIVYKTIIPFVFLFSYKKKVNIQQANLVPSDIIIYLQKKKYHLSLKDPLFDKPLFKQLIKQQSLQITNIIQAKNKPKKIFLYSLQIENLQNSNLTIKEKNFIQQFQKKINNYNTKKELLKFASSYIINKLLQKKILNKTKKNIVNSSTNISSFIWGFFPDINLNVSQNSIWNQINCSFYQTYLLVYEEYNDKIAIYLKLIVENIKQKKQTLILLPEIILIQPLVACIKKILPNLKIAVLHHKLNNESFLEQNQQIKDLKVHLVIGSRSAIFVPFHQLGGIIIDEEHDESLIEKEKTPFYDTRELAQIRAIYHHIPLILTSRTPSLESVYQIQKKKYQLLRFPVMPKTSNIQLIDMKEELKKGNFEPFSDILFQNLKKAIKNKQKTLLFINAKGFSSFLLCRLCSYVFKCRRCQQNMTWFLHKNILKCRFCHHIENFSKKCFRCQQTSIRAVSFGIEYIEKILKEKFFSAKIIRLDSDTIKNNKKYEKILTIFRKKDIDILLGTEMIAKNLTIPSIYLVGIITADILLNTPTFKATEKTFQLLAKITKYNNYSNPIIVQSYNTQHYALQTILNYDLKTFYQKALQERKLSQNPPFWFVSKILISHNNFFKSSQIATNIKEHLHNYHKQEIKVFGPSVTNIKKKNNLYRFVLILKYKEWPLNLNFIIEKKLQQDAYILFDRFANII